MFIIWNSSMRKSCLSSLIWLLYVEAIVSYEVGIKRSCKVNVFLMRFHYHKINKILLANKASLYWKERNLNHVTWVNNCFQWICVKWSLGKRKSSRKVCCEWRNVGQELAFTCATEVSLSLALPTSFPSSLSSLWGGEWVGWKEENKMDEINVLSPD